jgi:DinB family protein
VTPALREHTVASLSVTPAMLREMTRDCTGSQAATPPKPGEWSIVEIVRHLVEGDRDTFVPRLRRMLAESKPVFERRPPQDGDRADLAALLDAFADARSQAVALLRGLADHGWRREGVSPSRGALTVESYARTMTAHDTEHLRQIQDVRATLGLPPKRCEARVALPIPELRAALARTPDLVAQVASGLDGRTLRERPAPGEWSIKEALAHLMELDGRLFLPRLRRMALEDTPRFEAFDPKAWEAERDRREGRFEDDLAAFRGARADLLAFLTTVSPELADRAGWSSHFGPLTLAQYATHAADHDLEHLGQMRACRAVVAPRG